LEQLNAKNREISPELQGVLQRVVDDVVNRLGCLGAMVAPLELDNTLPVRAYAIKFAPTLLNQLEKRLGISIVGPNSVAYLDDDRFKDNLSVLAIKGIKGQPEVVVSNKLHDLFRPVVNKYLSDFAQKLTGIKQVIAVPFFLNDEVVGNLFAAARDDFSQRDIEFLSAFGNQAAIAIQSQHRLIEIQALERVVLALQSSIADETQVMQTIVDAVVYKLGHVGSMVATMDIDNNALPVRAFAVDISSDLLTKLEKTIGLSFVGPKSVAYLDDEKYQDNLSVRAMKGNNGRPEKYIVSDKLYDLFRPIVNETLSDLAQKFTGIKQVIVVPFSIGDEKVGNLFVATRKSKFSARDIQLLITFGQQAAVGIRNAQLYRQAENRRRIAQIFGKMAFSAAAYIHSLRNHVGVSRNYIELMKMMPRMSEEQRAKFVKSGDDVLFHLGEAVDILDHLHEPWRQHADVPTDVNDCLVLAVRKAFRKLGIEFEGDEIPTDAGIVVHKDLTDDLPTIETSPDMLTEAFNVLIKNALEAMKELDKVSDLWVQTDLEDKAIKMIIRDNGPGIKPSNLAKIFEMGWSSKEGKGMGFGLFWTKDYIEGLGGNIKTDSIVGEGTTFFITLPIA